MNEFGEIYWDENSIDVISFFSEFKLSLSIREV